MEEDATPADGLSCEHAAHCLRRRELLGVAVGGAAAGLLLPAKIGLAQGRTGGADPDVYPEKRVARLSELGEGEPLAFSYPLDHHPNLLIKLGAPALRGVGPERDIVAFSALCTHMGGNLTGRYRHDGKALGPCPFHFSVFDLRKGGIPVHASATQNLPQILLETDGEDIVAVGVVGLIYGQRNNLADGKPAAGTTPGKPGAPRIMRG